MQTTRLEHIAFLAEFCSENQVSDVVISPGSRNAPIVIAFDAHPAIRTHLIHDERSAAFYALGIAEATQKPVALTCTSGSALLNYAPAIAEAYYRRIPLLILSADRPAHLIDQGDGQTIRQQNVFANFIKMSLSYPESGDNMLEKAAIQLKKAFTALLHLPQGPVHINVPLNEPLYETTNRQSFQVEKVENHDMSSLDTVNMNDVKQIWSSATKKMLIIGQHHPDKRLEEVVKMLAEDASLAVLVENTSNVQSFPRFCHCIDRTLEIISDDELENYAPDLILSVGGAVISKRIKAYFRKFKPKHNWRIGVFQVEEDTYQSLTKSISVDPVHFIEALLEQEIAPLSNFGGMWKQKDLMANEMHKQFVESAPFSDLKVFDTLLDVIPDDAVLHMANSSVVRYCQLFNPVRGIDYRSNRGVSGIDGSASTAAGFSIVNTSKLNVLISGDTSFFYDSNGFWNKELKGNFKVFVLNNGGGGIFKIIPGPAESEQSEIFYAPTNADVQGICQAFNLNYYLSESVHDILNQIEDFFQLEENNRPSVMEINTKDVDNARVLKDYFTSLRDDL
ncbi:MAG: 2-succinyl-5-enolpyruvyl-6-hydroxy-3-cyclohexene-1-carboxylic-acid synthase [Crocinitomicaceae bacterium]|nr:2-succinyl-5-enolpyruvyl-6-hydroxy-3-cyclohexene-1-carboxylic-acid synthase [Crocinitomicaceae bacterium]